MGADIKKGNKSFASKGHFNADILTVQGNYEADIFSRAFAVPDRKILRCGLPRNDFLANYTERDKLKIKQKLSIPLNKQIILYAPTFREYERDKMNNIVFKSPINLSKWEEHLKDQYCLIFRAHYENARIMNITENKFVRDMSAYETMEDLMIVSDILISDYSSVFFDYSIMNKIMLHYTYDYDEYSSKRGMYFDIRNYLTGSNNEDELLRIIASLDEEKEKKITNNFRNTFVDFYGSATKKILDYIWENIRGGQ